MHFLCTKLRKGFAAPTENCPSPNRIVEKTTLPFEDVTLEWWAFTKQVSAKRTGFYSLNDAKIVDGPVAV